VAGERGSGNAREIEGIRAGEENFRVAKTDSLLTRAMIGEVEGRGPGSGVATCRLEEWGVRCYVGVLGRQRHDRDRDKRCWQCTTRGGVRDGETGAGPGWR
jgi:hypothetical protein